MTRQFSIHSLITIIIMTMTITTQNKINSTAR
jgi:hypothetical protein